MSIEEEEHDPIVKLRRPKRFRPALNKLFGSILAVCTLIGAVAVLYPRLIVDPQNEIDRYNTDNLAFLLRNTGYYPLYNVSPMLGICQISWGIPNSFQRCDGPLKTRLLLTPWRTKILYPDDPQTIELGTFSKRENILMTISYIMPISLLLWNFNHGSFPIKSNASINLPL